MKKRKIHIIPVYFIFIENQIIMDIPNTPNYIYQIKQTPHTIFQKKFNMMRLINKNTIKSLSNSYTKNDTWYIKIILKQ
jgi:hypothetical protein